MADPTTTAAPNEHEALTTTSNNSPVSNGHNSRNLAHRYEVEVVPEQDYKSNEFRLGSFARPHMRAFHYAWFGFFVAKVAWYCTVEALPVITASFAPTEFDLLNATLIGLLSETLARVAVGPICDAYGPRVPFAAMLVLGSLPIALVGVIHSRTGLYLQKLFGGIILGTLVPGVFWASRMFAKEVVGTANALVAGWGDLGTGMAGVIMWSILKPWFQSMTNDESVASRTECLVPAAVALVTGVLMYCYTDDSPRGQYKDLKKTDSTLAAKRPLRCFVTAVRNVNLWILAVQYACCFGLELVLNYVAVLYFQSEFGLDPMAAIAIGNIFGWLEFFARPLGGIASDLANARWGMRGRLWVQTATLALEGAFTLVFATCHTLGGSITVLIFFGLFVKAAKGSTFGVVPYVSPPNMGSVIGLVSSGGVAGAMAFGSIFEALEYRHGLIWTGVIVMLCSLLSALIRIDGHRSLFTGVDRNVDPETGIIRFRSSKDSNTRTPTDNHMAGDDDRRQLETSAAPQGP